MIAHRHNGTCEGIGPYCTGERGSATEIRLVFCVCRLFCELCAVYSLKSDHRSRAILSLYWVLASNAFCVGIRHIRISPGWLNPRHCYLIPFSSLLPITLTLLRRHPKCGAYRHVPIACPPTKD
ncbi:hypothetical protein B0H14DRAFT_338764 [Mycena olivaceomarginata]|nr:hypothetical protein B0H14DRAFT_338764 [Mycena olivaceomarginata]